MTAFLLFVFVDFTLSAVIFEPLSENEISLTEVVDDRIDDRADGHLAVADGLSSAAEIEERFDRMILQQPCADRLSDHIIRQNVAHENLDHETKHTLPGGLAVTEENVVARQVPNQAAKGIVHDGRNVLAEAAHIEQNEHNAGAEYEIEDADDQVVRKGAIYHRLDLHHIITVFSVIDYAKVRINQCYYTLFRQKMQLLYFCPIRFGKSSRKRCPKLRSK